MMRMTEKQFLEYLSKYRGRSKELLADLGQEKNQEQRQTEELMTIRFTGRKYFFKFLSAAFVSLVVGKTTMKFKREL